VARPDFLVYVRCCNISREAFPRGVEPTDLYTSDASSPLGIQAGLRDIYEFNLYLYCTYLDTSTGACSKAKIGSLFVPYGAIMSDMPID
jgi:hypothetical protein